MSNSILIKPAEFIGYGICPKCGSPLCLMEKETNWYKLNNDGYPILNFANYSYIEAVCEECGTTFEYVRDGMSFRPFIQHEQYIREQVIKDSIIKVTEETINEFNKNPFGFIKERLAK